MNRSELNQEDLDQAISQAVDVMAQFLGVQEIEEKRMPSSPIEQKIVELESVLANASFAHEYAIIHLNTVDSERERAMIAEELERYHETYAGARTLLAEIDNARLIEFEKTLEWQKNAILRGYKV